MMTSQQKIEALEKENRLLKAALNAYPHITLIKDYEGRFVFANTALAMLYGTTPDKMIGLDDGAFNPNHEQVEFYKQNCRSIMDDGYTHIVTEDSTDTATGKTTHYQSVKAPFKNDHENYLLVMATDITSLIEEQERISNNAKRLDYLFGSLQEGVWDWQIQTGQLEHNATWFTILGYEMGVLSRTIEDFQRILYPDDREKVFTKVQEAIASGQPYVSEHRLVKNDGSVIWVRDRGAVVEWNEQGEPIRMVGSFLDISENKKHEQFLSEAKHTIEQSEQQLRLLFDKSPIGVRITSRDGTKIRFANPAYASFINVTMDQMSAFDPTLFYTNPQDYRAILSEIAHDDSIINRKLALTINNEQRWVIASFIPFIFDDEESVLGWFFDVTEQEEQKGAIKRQKEEFETIFNTSKDGIAILDLESNFLEFNNSYIEMTGFSREELLQKSCIELTAPQDVERSRQAMSDVMTKGAVTNFEKTCVVKDGRQIIITMSMVLMPDKKRILASTKDITQSRKMQEELIEAKEAAERANDAKGLFLANMSHEIRTPLNGIMGLTELVLMSNLEPKQYDYLSKVQKSSKALLSIINDILDYSKIEAGKLDLEHISFDPQALFETVTSLFEYQAQQKGLKFEVSVSTPLPRLMGDPLRLTQILNNLVGNAIKFTREGEVTLNVTGKQRGDTGYDVYFAVRDTGIGMTVEQQNRLFSPFTQADSSFTRSFGGTGLGLSITKQLVTLMEGTIEVDSLFGQGTTFVVRLYFDRDTDQAVTLNPQETAQLPLGSGQVLLVEDNEINQIVAVELLKKLGLRVDIAENGREAIDKVLKGDYKIIFMDLQMPIMDGFEATQTIRGLYGAQELPIVAMTAAVMEKDLQHIRDVGMNDYVSKPVSLQDLTKVLHQWGAFALSQVDHNALHRQDLFDQAYKKLVDKFDGDAHIVRQLLHRFVGRMKEPLETLATISVAEQQNFLHTLKGIVGNLEFVHLYHAIMAWEKGENSDIVSLQKLALETIEHCQKFLADHKENPSS